MKNKNLILSPAINYSWIDLEVFVKSLRKYYDGKIIFLVSKIDSELKKKFKYYSIDVFNVKKSYYKNLIDNQPKDISQIRYFIYEKILKKINNLQNVMICDSRDIFFQQDPFMHYNKKKLNFFMENEKIENCKVNKKWLLRTIGKNNFKKIKTKYISCSGTTIGHYLLIKDYLEKMCYALKKFPYSKPLFHRIFNKGVKIGYDQGIHNYVLYNFFLNSNYSSFNFNHNGFICTAARMRKFNFNNKGELCNKNNKAYSVVHQYDRFEKIFDKKLNKLLKL